MTGTQEPCGWPVLDCAFAPHVQHLRDRIEALEAERDTAIAAAYEAAAREIDCGCAGRAAVLTAETKTDRWRACGTDPCGAEAAQYVRAMIPADAIAARDADRARVRREALEAAALRLSLWPFSTSHAATEAEQAIRAMIEQEEDK